MDLPVTLLMFPGQTLTFTLPGLGAAGYLWFVEVSGEVPSEAAAQPHPGALQVVVATIERGGSPRPGGEVRVPVGRGLPQTLRLTAGTPGTATVTVVQQRPWEDGPPREERHTEVVVRDLPGDGRPGTGRTPPAGGHSATRGPAGPGT